MIQETIKNFLQQHHISRDAGFILAVSGGADSICMLHAFKYLNLKMLVLHCNFSLRGKESDMDEQFVKRFCDSYGIAHSVKKFDTLKYARENGLSVEMAARELRYTWFREMKEKKKMDYIVVAHHADDVAETVLINLCRGTGIKGLTGIKSINGDILRPLLPCSRTDILKYIEINPSFLDTMTENCETLKETEEIFQYGIHRFQEEILDCEEDELLIHISKTLATPAPYTFLYETLKPFGFNKVQIRDILNTHTAIPGKQFIAGHHTLERGRIFWRLYDNSKCSRTIVSIPTTGIYTIGKLKVEFTLFPRTEEFVIPQQPDIACLDADKLQFPLLIRNWQAGDYFCPIGMKKSKKKLSDFFRDQKFSSKQKQECLLLLSDEKIAWIIGNRPDDRFKITSFTSNILQISIL